MSLTDLLLGKPLATSEEHSEQIGASSGVAIFGLDGLSSAAYGPEAALTLLLPLGFAGIEHIVPITAAIIGLLLIVFVSYRQTIDAYPNGGGSYTVATENLGVSAGLLAAAALMIDYVLTAAVGISAGVGALISAVPTLQPHTLSLCLGILAVLTLINLRGVRDTGLIILVPTYLFIGSLLLLIGLGLFHTIVAGGHPHAVIHPPKLPGATEALSFWLLLKVFSSGCTAMTGVEAVSNGANAFREPRAPTAKKTLTVIIATLVALLAGIAFLCRAYNVGATDPNSPHYQSVLSELLQAVTGRGIFYWVAMSSILLVLALSANTAFAGFPRVLRVIALNGYLPRVFTLRGRRLLYSWGVYLLVLLTAMLLLIFRGVTDRLIPLYAIGAFLAFTLSQAGMVEHWRKNPGKGSRFKMLVNGIGAFATGITTLVVLVTKFVSGAWVTALLIPLLIMVMVMVHHHYERVRREISTDAPLDTTGLLEPFVIVPIDRWSRISEKALRLAMVMSSEVQAVHVMAEEDGQQVTICDEWEQMVVTPLRAANRPVPELVTLSSPFRFVLLPMVKHVLEQEKRYADRHIAVLVPELVVKHWYENLLHNQRGNLLKLLLLVRGNQRIFVINIPWYL
ncbi:APC family permease [Acidipila sp. EB88]|uniref:APC family permease n=1 Tax=Acidipila sp. EB88 TaxID=2305226 RepID=UPI000F5E84CF|nr:APC family permease [Acidipila sp. EB88]RRA48446.1 APC family permease [Acidipila sp. EB88]